jgi:alpha-1,3-rhamnosyl/mannosyltransferase
LVVDPRDDVALATALRRVLEDRALAADLRERGLRRAALYSWARCADATVSVYREVTGRAPHPARR